jgi:actin-related protein
MASTVASAIRPGLREGSSRQPSGSPHTPTSRFISSAQSSPGSSSFRAEEDPILIELDQRGFSAGFQGESGPQCYIPFTPQNSRRVGDHRAFLPDVKRRKHDVAVKSEEYELWRNDLQDFDLGLLEDKLERAVREAYNKHLLVDAGLARLVLVLPSVVPHPVLSAILTMLFERWKYTMITLLPAPTMTIAGAGLRAGLIVDVGWEETVVTAVYEFREVLVRRTVRGMKALTINIAHLLERTQKEQAEAVQNSLVLDFDAVEEFVDRAGACHALFPVSRATLMEKMEDLGFDDRHRNPRAEDGGNDKDLTIEWPTHCSARTVSIPRDALHKACQDTWMTPAAENHPDDHEQSVPELIYKALLALSMDVRGTCSSRIIFSGRGCAVAGLPENLLEAVTSIIHQNGWTAVRGKNITTQRNGLSEISQARSTRPRVPDRHALSAIPEPSTTRQEFSDASKEVQVSRSPPLKQVQSLGPWAGASLIASLKVRSFVEIERERFLSHGLAGAHRDWDSSLFLQQQQQRMATTKGSERTSWTLAGWG